MQMRLSSPLECKFSSVTVAGEFEGLASTFNGPVDAYGDIVLPGAFKASLAKHQREATAPAMLWHHRPDEPIGTWHEIRETERGLSVKGKLTLDSTRGRDAHALMRDGALSLSIGYITKDHDYDGDGNRLLKEIDLWEVSAVSLPANRAARITAVKATDIRSFEAALRDACGFSVREARKLASGGWRALRDDDEQTPEFADAVRALTKQLRGY
jgi:HK97 family phage prohead protease